MRKFDLELAKQGKKVVDEQGRIGYYVGSIENPFSHIFAFDNTKPNQQFIALYNDYGLCAANPCYNKLSMATEKKTVWVNVYKRKCDGHLETDKKLFDTKEIALHKSYCNDEWVSIGNYSIEVEV